MQVSKRLSTMTVWNEDLALPTSCPRRSSSVDIELMLNYTEPHQLAILRVDGFGLPDQSVREIVYQIQLRDTGEVQYSVTTLMADPTHQPVYACVSMGYQEFKDQSLKDIVDGMSRAFIVPSLEIQMFAEDVPGLRDRLTNHIRRLVDSMPTGTPEDAE